MTEAGSLKRQHEEPQARFRRRGATLETRHLRETRAIYSIHLRQP